MNKIIFTTLFLVTAVFGSSYNFVETRYSDALAKSMELRGVITFNDGLTIEYENSDKALVYEDGELELLEDGEAIELDENEALKIAQYFEIIIMLYNGDESKMASEFEILKLDKKNVLTPKNELKKYMFKIELAKDKRELKEIVMHLSNYDKITISILDEIR